MEERRAWLIFLNSSNYYLYMLLGLYKNLLDVKTKYPIYCGVTKNVNSQTRKILSTVGLNLIELDTSLFTPQLLKTTKSKTCEHYFQAFTKLALLNTDIEKMFDKIVYIDTDVQVLKNIDDVFDYPHMSAIEDNAPSCDRLSTKYTLGCSKFCSGMFVWDFKNNPGKGREIILNLPKLDKRVGWHDQAVLNFHYPDWREHIELHIPPEYGLMNNGVNFRKMPFENIKAIHYTGRLKTDWPFNRRKELEESNWKHGNLHFKEWVTSIAYTINYFNKTYDLAIPIVHSENLILVTRETRESQRMADGQPNTYLYF